jgi:hypothetical protein
MIGDRGTLQSQAPITIPPKSEPEPDFAIIKNRDDNYLFIYHLTPKRLISY